MNKGNLESLYETIKEKRKDRDNHIETVQKLDKEIQFELLQYRIVSVIRVLEHLSKVETGFDNLIIHCLNKLNGDIDGVELPLGENK